MMGVIEANVRGELSRGSAIERSANRLGPIYYELRKAREARRRERVERLRAAIADHLRAVRALLLPADRIPCQADCTGTQ